MKTIEVTDEMYDRLVAMAQEIETQDNRGTAKPYLFQIQTDYKVYDESQNGDKLIFVDHNEDYQEVDFTKDNVLKWCTEVQGIIPDWLSECEDDDDLLHASRFDYRYDSWLEKTSLSVTSVSIAHKYQNAFFTAKACEAHINGNRHHYDNPKSYLNYANRNPEMELMFSFLQTLAPVEVAV